MVPLSCPPINLILTQTRPTESVAIAIVETGFGYGYVAIGEFGSCSGEVFAPTAEVAALDVINDIRAGEPVGDQVRFVVNLPSRGPLWRYTGQSAEVATGWQIERPSDADRSLTDTVCALLPQAFPVPRPSPPAVTGSVIVATDGSVGPRHAGFGWLSFSGDFGLAGYRSSLKRVGSEEVLVAELCAIGDAVRGLPGRLLTVLCDSRAAIAMVNRWMQGESVMPAEYPVKHSYREQNLHTVRRRICVERDRIDLRWVKGHSGHPLNGGANALARLGARYRRGNSDMDEDAYRRRADEFAQRSAAEFRRVNSM